MKIATLTYIDDHPTQVNVDEVFFVMCWDDESCFLLVGSNSLRPGRVFVKGTLQEVAQQLYGNGELTH